MNSSFSVTSSNYYTRQFGGTKAGTADMYVSGYHFIWFRTLPSQLPIMVAHARNVNGEIGSGGDGLSNIKYLLSASCLSVTPPGITLNKTEYQGLGGLKYAVPTNIDYGNTLSIRFVEFSGLPISNIFHSWMRLMRDYRTGTSPLNNTVSAYTKSAYSSTMLYWTTKPDGKTVEYYAAYTGVFPTKDPQDSFSSDLSTNDKLEIDMEFHLDMMWHEPWVLRLATQKAAEFHNSGIGTRGGFQGMSNIPGTVNESNQ